MRELCPYLRTSAHTYLDIQPFLRRAVLLALHRCGHLQQTRTGHPLHPRMAPMPFEYLQSRPRRSLQRSGMDLLHQICQLQPARFHRQQWLLRYSA